MPPYYPANTPHRMAVIRRSPVHLGVEGPILSTGRPWAPSAAAMQVTPDEINHLSREAFIARLRRCSHGTPLPCLVARTASLHGNGVPWLQPECVKSCDYAVNRLRPGRANCAQDDRNVARQRQPFIFAPSRLGYARRHADHARRGQRPRPRRLRLPSRFRRGPRTNSRLGRRRSPGSSNATSLP